MAFFYNNYFNDLQNQQNHFRNRMTNMFSSKPVSPISTGELANPPPTTRRSITVVDISRKRRSGSCENKHSNGQPFLNPISRVIRQKPRRSFFRAHQGNPELSSLEKLMQMVSQLNQRQAFRVGLGLGIKAPNLIKLQQFVSSISPQDEQMISNVQAALSNVITTTRPVLEESSQIPANEYPFIDCRYSKHPSSDHSLIIESVSIGPVAVNLTFQIPKGLPDLSHVVIQTFQVGVSPPTVRWPQSFTLLVRGKVVKPPGMFPFNILDITQFGPETDITVKCNVENARYIMLVRVAKYSTYNQLALELQNTTSNDFLNETEVSIYSPITGQVMKHPGRGVACIHSQCFDIKEYLSFCSVTQKWFCPICNMHTPFKNLIYSHMMKSYIDKLCIADPNNMIFDAGAFGPADNVKIFDGESSAETLPIWESFGDEYFPTG